MGTSRAPRPGDPVPRGGPCIAFVAALEREVAALIRTWKCRSIEYEGRRHRVFQNGEAVLICGGIGPEAARRATEAVIREVGPSLVVSAGFAGAIDPALKVADIIEPGVVINASDGARVGTGRSEYALVSYPSVAGKDQKRKLCAAFGAALVDMEAASVAQGAEARGVRFGALKVVSDDAEFAMPDMARFVTDDGRFRQARFVLYVAIRPWLWGTTFALARNSARASRALCDAIADYLKRERVSTMAEE